jgi:serine/threonine protein kinase
LQARDIFEGYEVLRELHASSRSHVYLAKDQATGLSVALKIPAVAQHEDPAYLDRFVLEEWIAKRIDNPHVLRPAAIAPRPRQHLFVVMEYLPQPTLAQWLRDHPQPHLNQVRRIVSQIGQGLQAFHRREMLYLDLRPENILIDAELNIKIIDFGAVRVAGLAEMQHANWQTIMGDLHYCAPEYLLGEAPSQSADLYALGVLCYHILTQHLPYGVQMAALRKPKDLKRLRYRSALDENRPIPAWLDAVLERAVHPQPHKRQQAISEFLHDLHHPSEAYLRRQRPPLLERDPLRFWQASSAVLLCLLLFMAWNA